MIPAWLGNLVLVGGAFLIVGIGIAVLVWFGTLYINKILPAIWVTHKQLKIKNMSKEKFEAYILALREEWMTNYIEKGKKEKNDSTE